MEETMIMATQRHVSRFQQVAAAGTRPPAYPVQGTRPMDTGLILRIAIVVIALLLLGYGASIYNSLVQVRNNVGKAWRNIDVLLQQRHDELPKLVDACSAYMKHEREVLDQLTRLRVRYGQAPATEEKTQVENQLNQQLARLRLNLEAYPDLKASQNFLQV